ncbi:pentatricopeptide repeat-containing protein mitochondrial-like [Dorcoceras hygrometricum]|uniref:Pentatricopeptide repeat-containing protein mitochondrial-like n=1 Tax=Dorcoceras hygrometricum TaxID=472368 RepID=A0A2Z7B6U0_9LAMI|nr:pentatricopeptide repeat-containing protein mitochondrial-like [Dorcoceras hygrometricum]
MNSRLKAFSLGLQTSIEHRRSRNFNCPYSHAYGGLRTRLLKQPRPHKPTRNQLREPIPFLDHIKQCEDPDEAFSTFHRYHEMGCGLDYPSYASIIYKLARAKKFESVDTVLSLLQTRDIKCQEALFIALMRHYEKARLIDKAIGLFREMGRSFNCVRTVQSFNTMLNAFVVNDRVSEAVDFFKDGSKMGFKLNPVSFNIMIKMWLGKGDWEKARQVFDQMLERELEPTVVTYNSQIGFLCKRGDVDEAKMLFEDLVRKGKRGNAVTYALLMEGLCDSGRFNEAKKMMFDMEYQGCKVELVNYGVLMSNLAKRGLISEAKGMLVEMKKRRIKPDVVMYNILINSLCKEGAASEAYKLLVDMQVKGYEPNAATYRTVVDGFCRVGDFVCGLKVLNAMLCGKHIPRLETFCSLVIGLIRCGDVNGACFVLEEMERRKTRLTWESWEILVSESCLNHEVVTGILADIVCSCEQLTYTFLSNTSARANLELVPP